MKKPREFWVGENCIIDGIHAASAKKVDGTPACEIIHTREVTGSDLAPGILKAISFLKYSHVMFPDGGYGESANYLQATAKVNGWIE